MELKECAKLKKKEQSYNQKSLAFKLSIVKTGNLFNIHQLFLDDLLPSRTCAKGRGHIKEYYGENLSL